MEFTLTKKQAMSLAAVLITKCNQDNIKRLKINVNTVKVDRNDNDLPPEILDMFK
jgi:hypothetical protein